MVRAGGRSGQVQGIAGAQPVPVSGTFGPPVALGQAAMAASLPVVLASDQSAVPIAPITSAYSAVTPAPQNSTNVTAVVTGSGIDARAYRTVAYTIAIATHDVDWSVFGANASDYSDEIAVLAATKVAAAAFSSYVANPAPFAYYRVKIIDDAGGTHGAATVRAIAKG